MLIPVLCTVGLAGALLIGPEPAVSVSREQHLQQFLQARPGVSISQRAGRISRVYGRTFSGGATAAQSAESFLTDHAGMFGVAAGELVADGPGDPGLHAQPIMYDQVTGTYKFTGYFYTQHRDNVPVFRTALKLLVRNDPGFPMVLATVDLRDLGGFRVDAGAVEALPGDASRAAAIVHAEALAMEAGPAKITSSRKVIWAGLEGDEAVLPTLADETLLEIGPDRWLVLTDATTGGVLYQEHLIYTVDLTGTIQGLSTTGIGADMCEAEVATALPYLVVEMISSSPVVTDANGDFVFPDVVAGSLDIYAFLDGVWFDVDNVQGVDAVEFLSVTPPDRADLLFNTDNTDELVRAQVNAYVHANRIRDFVLDYNPDYPALGAVDFPINVNRTDGFCPGNAWYDPAGGGSINFCASQGSSPNTAWSSVIYHEYGHHLVNVAGSGQCEYGEGMGDTLSVLMLDDPEIGVGFFGSCLTSLRSADVDCQYSPTSCTTNCGDECHLCGRLLAASVWSTRNELVVTHPADYINILSGLMINSILLHVGTSITPDIAVDLLVLDDDDADLCNGTPHSAEIIAGFAAHGLVEESFNISLPEPLPTVIDPAGGTTVRVSVCGPLPLPADSVKLNVYAPELGGWFNIATTEVASGIYEGAFPERECGEGVLYFFRADLPGGGVQYFPDNGPTNPFVTISAASVEIALTDDFETDQGWTVSGSSVAGTWERGVPISNTICDAGNPDTDGDGSGQCFVTDNDPLTCPSDVDGGTTILTSPVMDVTGGLPALTYLEWFHNTLGSSLFEDHFTIDASNDGGKTWTNVQTIGSGGFPVIGAWRQRAHRLADFVTPTDQFRVRFTASDIGTDATVEAAVDAVQLLLASCGPLTLGDLDGDGIVGIADFLALLGAWGPCDVPCPPSCVADLDDDCTVGINDFLILLANWTT